MNGITAPRLRTIAGWWPAPPSRGRAARASPARTYAPTGAFTA